MNTQQIYSDFNVLLQDINNAISNGSNVYYGYDNKAIFDNDNAYDYIIYGDNIFDMYFANITPEVRRKLMDSEHIIFDDTYIHFMNFSIIKITNA